MKTAEDILSEKGAEVVCVTKVHSVFEAIRMMNERKIGAILVKEGDEVIGIWTERDFLRNSGDPQFRPQNRPGGGLHVVSPAICPPRCPPDPAGRNVFRAISSPSSDREKRAVYRHALHWRCACAPTCWKKTAK